MSLADLDPAYLLDREDADLVLGALNAFADAACSLGQEEQMERIHALFVRICEWRDGEEG